ncbi:unnamed protein product [Vitrella brassicaformis CCMP3155]|uniref:HTH CENPB-type domain-containing protein n=1 Tax=Vitrella brassicaformis (strain CCMP3155) TaxID=1169540 RepID=A0A0G4EMX0_VITBC|nr:unnamed protein product [Vitrella brassicaformis CCMP3155]|eukprot:CEL98330.1 unnamed protein product [Vitrella brassicaformis CCMP3155]
MEEHQEEQEAPLLPGAEAAHLLTLQEHATVVAQSLHADGQIDGHDPPQPSVHHFSLQPADEWPFSHPPALPLSPPFLPPAEHPHLSSNMTPRSYALVPFFSSDEQQPSGASEALCDFDHVTDGTAQMQAAADQQGAPAQEAPPSGGQPLAYSWSEDNSVQRAAPAISDSLHPDGRTDGLGLPQPSGHHLSPPVEAHPSAVQWPFGHPAALPPFIPHNHLEPFPPAGYQDPSLPMPLPAHSSDSHFQLPLIDPLMAGAPGGLPLSTEGSLRQRASSLPPPRTHKAAPEVTLAEREALLADFERRKEQGEELTMRAFAVEKGITLSQFKHWYYRSKGGAHHEAADKTKKRTRKSPYQPIEDEIRQWLVGHDDPTSISVEHMRRTALEIAQRLGISGFKASDRWISDVKKRYKQTVASTDQTSPAAAADAAAASAVPPPSIYTNGMTGDQDCDAFPQEGTHRLRGADASKYTQGALNQTDQRHVFLFSQSTESVAAPPSSREGLSDQQGQVADESAAVRMADGFIGRRHNDWVTHRRLSVQNPPAADGDRRLHQQSQYSRQEAHVPAAAAVASTHPHFPVQPPHSHPLPRPLTHPLEAAPAAAAASREADGFIGPTTDLSRQTTTCPPDDDAAVSDRPLDEQSQHSGQKTMSIFQSGSRLTNERPPNKIQKAPTRSHREGPPSVVLSRSSAKSVLTMTADDRLSDIPEDDDGDAINVSDDASSYVTALSSRSTTDGDDRSPDRQVVTGSSLTSTECAALRPVLALGMLDECELTLLYRASRDGAEYGDLLRCVGDAQQLVFVIRKDKYVFGAFISANILVPDHPRGMNRYLCDGWDFSLAGHFPRPTKVGEGLAGQMWGDRLPVGGAKLWIGAIGGWLELGCEGGVAADMRSCRHIISSHRVLEGYVGVRDEYGRALFGGSEEFMADEVEVIRVDGRSLLSLKVIEGANFDPLHSAALYRFLGLTTGNTLKLIYRASRDGPLYADLLRCVGDANSLVFVVSKDKYVFGVFISEVIRLPDYNDYGCDVWHFSLAGHFHKPTKIEEGKGRVWVAGRGGTLFRAKLVISGNGWLELGSEDGSAADMRSCRQWIHSWDVPQGYVGVRDEGGRALFGGSRELSWLMKWKCSLWFEREREVRLTEDCI